MATAKTPTAPEPEVAPGPRDGYYRTVENVVVYRTYLPNGMSSQHIVQGKQGELPDGVMQSEVTNDE